jgi:hypothetical protein
MCPRWILLVALALLLPATAVTASVHPGNSAHRTGLHMQSARLVRSGGFAYYHRVLAVVRPGDASALARLSALLPVQLPAAPRAVLCADCRTTRLDLVVDGRRFRYGWDASPPRSLRPLVAALLHHG